jgi:ABC-type phosphate transport system auxiliary subunit
MEQFTLLNNKIYGLLSKIKTTTKHKDALPLIKELEEFLIIQEKLIKDNENSFEIQINQLKTENQRLNHL